MENLKALVSKEDLNNKIDSSKEWLTSLFENDSFKDLSGVELKYQLLYVVSTVTRDLNMSFDSVVSAIINYSNQYNTFTARQFQNFKM